MIKEYLPSESGRCRSRAWVGLDGRLCGFIIANQIDIPWAYMVPIESVCTVSSASTSGGYSGETVRDKTISDLSAPSVDADGDSDFDTLFDQYLRSFLPAPSSSGRDATSDLSGIQLINGEGDRSRGVVNVPLLQDIGNILQPRCRDLLPVKAGNGLTECNC